MKKLVVVLLGVFCSLATYGQYVFNNSRLNINPAFTGSDSTMVISSNLRVRQDDFFGENNIIIDFAHHSIDTYIRVIRGGLGLNYMCEKFYGDAHTRIEFNYAPHFELFKHKLVLQPAIQVSYIENAIDPSIQWSDGQTYSEPYIGSYKKSNVDLSTGLLLYNKIFFGGIAVHHLAEPIEDVFGNKLLREITIHGGANLKFKNDSTGKFMLSPYLITISIMESTQILMGITAKYKFISLGLAYSLGNDFIPTLAFQNKYLRVAYSYNFRYSSYFSGMHELGFNLFLKSKKSHCKIKTLRLI